MTSATLKDITRRRSRKEQAPQLGCQLSETVSLTPGEGVEGRAGVLQEGGPLLSLAAPLSAMLSFKAKSCQ